MPRAVSRKSREVREVGAEAVLSRSGGTATRFMLTGVGGEQPTWEARARLRPPGAVAFEQVDCLIEREPRQFAHSGVARAFWGTFWLPFSLQSPTPSTCSAVLASTP